MLFVFLDQGFPGAGGAQGLPVSTVTAPAQHLTSEGDLSCSYREPQVQKESQERP